MRPFLFYGDKGRATPFMYGDKGHALPLTNGDTEAVSHRSGPRASLSSSACHATHGSDRDLRAVRARLKRAARHDHGPRRRLGNTIGRRPHLQPEGKASEPRRVPIARLNALLVSKPRHLPKCTHEMYPRGRHRARLAAHDPMTDHPASHGRACCGAGGPANTTLGPSEGVPP
jgi:hypothetical protein